MIIRFRLALFALLATLLSIGVASYAGLIVLKRSLDPTQIGPVTGQAWVSYDFANPLIRWHIIFSDCDNNSDDEQGFLLSTLTLYEDGKSLGPPHSNNQTIINNGNGAFSYRCIDSWRARSIVFSASDNSNPRSNGRQYIIRQIVKIDPHLMWYSMLLIISLIRVSYINRYPISIECNIIRNIAILLDQKYLILLLIIVIYLMFITDWTSRWSLYNSFTDALLWGHNHLLVRPSAALLSLPDPFDPVANAPYRIHDASLFNGLFYIYYGITPVLLAFLPFKLMTFQDLPTCYAVLVFMAVGLFFCLLSFQHLSRLLPVTHRRATAIVAGLSLGVGMPLGYIASWPQVYEAAVTAGFMMISATLYFFLLGLSKGASSQQNRWLAVASLCLGLSVGARPHFVLLFAFLPVIWYASFAHRMGCDLVFVLRRGFWVFGPACGCVLALMTYNYARFGNPLEFGLHYQLAAVNVKTYPMFDPWRILSALYFYLAVPPIVVDKFPFIAAHTVWPFGELKGYLGWHPETNLGMLVRAPILILAFATPAIVWQHRHRLPRPLSWWLAGLCAASIVLFGLMLMAGASIRYQLDFMWLWMLAALISAIIVDHALTDRRRLQVLYRGTIILATAYTVLIGVAVDLRVMGYYY